MYFSGYKGQTPLMKSGLIPYYIYNIGLFCYGRSLFLTDGLTHGEVSHRCSNKE